VRRLSDRPELRLFARFVLTGVAAGIAAGIGVEQAGWATPGWLVGVGCLVAALLLGTLVLLAADFEPPPGPLVTRLRRTPTDRESGGLRRVERIVDDGLRDVDRFNSRVRPWLVRLAEQRLRHHSAIDLHHDPDSARDLLGGSLWQLMQQPLTTAPTQQELARWVARIEAL
jgi:hypothetical protein